MPTAVQTHLPNHFSGIDTVIHYCLAGDESLGQASTEDKINHKGLRAPGLLYARTEQPQRVHIK